MQIPEPVEDTPPQRTETIRPPKLTLADVEGLLRALGQDTNASFTVRTGYRRNRFQEFSRPTDVHRLLEPENIESFSASPIYSDGSRLNLRIGQYGVQFATELPEGGQQQLSDRAITNALLYLQHQGIGKSSQAKAVIGLLATVIMGCVAIGLLSSQFNSWFHFPGNTQVFAALIILTYPIAAIYFPLQNAAFGVNEKWLDTSVPDGASERARTANAAKITQAILLSTPFLIFLLEYLLKN
jgi:hypothetical protein